MLNELLLIDGRKVRLKKTLKLKVIKWQTFGTFVLCYFFGGYYVLYYILFMDYMSYLMLITTLINTIIIPIYC